MLTSAKTLFSINLNINFADHWTKNTQTGRAGVDVFLILRPCTLKKCKFLPSRYMGFMGAENVCLYGTLLC